MKLNDNYIAQEIDGELFLVPLGGEAFLGVVRCNEAGAFLAELLREETDEAALVEALCAEYDAPRSVVAADVADFLASLRRVGALM